MSLTVGARLGPYEILAPLGAGGMGEVYKARDTRLDRTVAIKVLPAHVASDPDLRQRFEREARAVAALNHPHICTLHDIGRQDPSAGSGQAAIDFLVMEYLEGETLAERLASGSGLSALGKALPVDQALTIAIQIASALDTAHRHGITHRDLKLGNIMLTKGAAARQGSPQAKLLDFGLAKTSGVAQDFGPAVAGRSKDLHYADTMAPTMSSPLTAQGTILGTFQYMAPEQLEGQEADPRTDIFAFGAVVYEMLTGKRAFEGKNQVSLMAAILEHEPLPISKVQPLTPPALDRVVKKCLAKDPDDRWQSARDLHDELTWIAETGSQVGIAAPTERVVPPRPLWRRVAIPTGAALAAAVVAGTAVWLTTHVPVPPPPALPAIRLSVAPPQNLTFGTVAGGTIPAVSPDGRRVAFVAARGGVNLLWVRSLDALEAQPLPGTDGAAFPFWSPDSRALGFFANVGTVLKTIDASGGPVRTLCDVPNTARGGTWSPDGVIVFGSSQSGGLFTVSANGGSPTPLTTPDAAQGDTAYRFPSFLPDGRHFLYWATPSNTVLLGSLDSKETTRLLPADSQAVYVAPGSLLFVRQGTLVAQPFDARRGTLTGEAVPIAEQVLPDVSGGAAFAASSSGVLAYRTGTLSAPTQLTWVDRAGRPLGTVGPPGRYRNPELSPDGTRVAVEATDPQRRTQDIWIVELARGLTSRFTFDPGNDTHPVWSPDSTQIMFGSDRGGGVLHLYQKRADGVGAEEPVLKSNAEMIPNNWAPDGRSVVYRNTAASGPVNLGVLPLAGERTPRLFEPCKVHSGRRPRVAGWPLAGVHVHRIGTLRDLRTELPGAGWWEVADLERRCRLLPVAA